MTMDQRRAQLSPIFEAQPALPSAPALVVHVEIQFTDPIIRSRYTRSYGSSPNFTPSPKICKGLLRRIERCSEELLTRKDSGALGMLKDGTFERKPLRYEIAFRISTREGGEWAERTYRSYQKQPLTVALTKDIIVASHRIVGLFLRRHDKDFRWLDGTVRDASIEGSQTMSPSVDGPLSLLCVPRSRFLESSQSFEFVPGYTVELSFRSRDPRRPVPLFVREVRVNSEQTAPLTLFLSEHILWQGLQAANRQLEPKKRDFDTHLGRCPGSGCHHSDEESLKVELRITNNLGPVHDDMSRTVHSKLALFPDIDDCERFFQGIEAAVRRIRDEADGKLTALNDFELRIVQLKGSGWSVHQLAMFSLDSSVSYGRRTIQAALDRVQTGIADVLRGFDVAIHISGHKRGHLILDKAIVAHAKRGGPREVFSSPEDEQKIFTSRLKARIQKDIDKVFEDTCSIDDIPEEERPATPCTVVVGADASTSEPSDFGSLPPTPIKNSPKARVQRMFSLSSRRSTRADTESLRSVGSNNDLRSAGDASESRSSRAFSVASEDLSEGPSILYEERPSPYLRSPIKPGQRRFPLVSRRYSSRISNVSNASTLIEEFPGGFEDVGSAGSAHDPDVPRVELRNVAVEAPEAKRALEDESGQGLQKSGLKEIGDALSSMTRGEAKSDDVDVHARMNLVAEPRINLTDGSVFDAECQSGTKAKSQARMDTPEQTFEDAEEFASGPDPAQIANPFSPAHDIPSPGIEIYSTAPSTPGLSWGADSSPRNSISATPTDQRTVSGTSVRNFEPESESDDADMGVEATINEVSVCKSVDDDSNARPIVGLAQVGCHESLRGVGSDEAAAADRQYNDDALATDLSSFTDKLGAEPSHEPPEECGSPGADSPTSDIREAATEQNTSLMSETISAPDTPGTDEAFGPANLWRIVASDATGVAVPVPVLELQPNLKRQVNKPLGPVDLWGILKGDEISAQEGPVARVVPVSETISIPEIAAQEVTEGPAAGDPEPKDIQDEAALENSIVEEDVPEQTVQEEQVPQQSVPKDHTSEEAAQEDPAAAKKSLPEEIAVEELAQEELVAEVVPEETARDVPDTGPQTDAVPEAAIPEVVAPENTLGNEVVGPVSLWGILRGNETTTAPEPEVQTDSKWVVVEPGNCTSIESAQSEIAEAEVIPESADQRPDPVQTPEVPAEASIDQEKADAKLPADEHKAESDSENAAVDTVEVINHDSGGGDGNLASVEVGPAEKTRALRIESAEISLPESVAVASEVSEIHEVVEVTPQDNTVTEEPEVADKKVVTETQDVASVGTTPGSHAVLPVVESLETGENVVDNQIGEDDSAVELTTSNINEIPKSTICNDTDSVQQEDAVVPDTAEEAIEPAEFEEPKVEAPEIETRAPVAGEEETTVDSDIQLTSGTITAKPSDAHKIDIEVAKEQDTRGSQIHDDAAGFKGDSGSEIANLEPEVSDDKPAVAPEISVQDFAPTAPEHPLVTDDVALSDTVGDVGQQTPEPKSDESLLTNRTTLNPTYLAPSHGPSPRTSLSSVSVSDWSDIQSVVNTSRDSVDTAYRASYEARKTAMCAQSPERCQSRPQTAGFLGLRESRLVEVGLRGALGDSRSRRLSLPLQNLESVQDAGVSSGEVTLVEPASSSVAEDKFKKTKTKILRSKKDEEVKAGAPVLPRVMMLVAGVFALGKVLKGPSH